MMTKFLRLALALGVLAALSAPANFAGSQDCIQACADQYLEDRSDCLEQLNTRLAQIEAETQACIEGCAPANFFCQAQCVRSSNFKRYNANSEYRQCLNRANTVAWNCYRGCQGSRFRP
jgi:hypothetical protein